MEMVVHIWKLKTYYKCWTPHFKIREITAKLSSTKRMALSVLAIRRLTHSCEQLCSSMKYTSVYIYSYISWMSIIVIYIIIRVYIYNCYIYKIRPQKPLYRRKQCSFSLSLSKHQRTAQNSRGTPQYIAASIIKSVSIRVDRWNHQRRLLPP